MSNIIVMAFSPRNIMRCFLKKKKNAYKGGGHGHPRTPPYFRILIGKGPGVPNDGFLANALKRCFRLSGVLLKLCRLIIGCAGA